MAAYAIYSGGLVGYNSGTITNCYAIGNVSSNSFSSNYCYAGSLVGHTSGTITNCYRYSGQIFSVKKNGTTTNQATNTLGSAKSITTLQSVTFRSSTLGWSADDWNFVAGQHPTLKNVGRTN